MIEYRFDIADALKRVGYSSTVSRKCGNMIPHVAYEALRDGKASMTLKTLNDICLLLDMQPKDLIRFVETDEDTARKNAFFEARKAVRRYDKK